MIGSLSAPAWVVAVAIAVAPACQRAASPQAEPSSPPPGIAVPPSLESAPGEVGPLGDDCYDTRHAKACPPDPSDPSGHKLPAYGAACRFPVCRPCGSETALSFRDEHGAPSVGFCICVPKSDSSGTGTLTCYGKEAWKNRAK